jgi:hypothetical protein
MSAFILYDRGVQIRSVVLAVALVAAGCGDDVIGGIRIEATPDVAPAVAGIAALTNDRAVSVGTADDPVAAAVPDRDFRIAIVVDLACTECYRIDAAAHPNAWIVHAGDLLGAQYGAAAALEDLGFRFRSPYDTYTPWAPRFDPAAAADLGVVHAPEVPVRGLQLHTIHPIEAYFALWEPGDDHTADADRIFSWIVANRGDFVQWVALNDLDDPTRRAEWQAQTATLLAHAHAIGLRAGLNIQLYAGSDKQDGFNLANDPNAPLADQLAARVPMVTDGLPFDVYDLSFGEFSGTANPQQFIDDVNQTAAALHAAAPAAQLHALVHLGAGLDVSYMGQTVNYYDLVRYCDPSIVPELHTVMFYDLYEDAGGAYGYTDFSDHRTYLLDRIAARQPAAYFPETAYWVAFDDSVPLYLPLYVRSRWLDLDRLASDPAAQGGALGEELVFSSGWEWGYWLNDYTALRGAFERPAAYRDLIAHAFAGDLDAAVDPVVGLADAEHDQLLTGRLAPYLAGRDILIDAARDLGVSSQPDRVTFEDLAADDAATRAAFGADVVARLASLAADLETRAAAIDALDVHDRWADELRDDADITALRARFVATAYQASLDQLGGDTAAAQRGRDTLGQLLGRAGDVVARRRGAMHSPNGATYTKRVANHTLYQYGYLYHADTLCYWNRELMQLEQQAGQTVRVPDCLL